MTMKGFILLAVLGTIFASVNSDEDDFIVEVLSPQGFRVSTKNIPGVQRIGFRGNINRELLRRQTAQYTGDFALQSDDFWVYENPTASLKPGDTLYYRPQILSKTVGVLNFVRQFHVPMETSPTTPSDVDPESSWFDVFYSTPY